MTHDHNHHIHYKIEGDIARLTLARPSAANALSGDMLRQITAALREVRASAARVLCISGEGKHFCAGADIEWMRASADPASNSEEDNRREADILAALLHDLHTLPQVTVAVLHGACYGGGAGLAAAADICLAADTTRFCFSEVRLGLIPATISPYITAAMGERQARRYFLDGAVFSAATAQRLGLVHEIAAADDLASATESQLAQILQGGADAQRRIKELLVQIRHRPIDRALIAYTAQALADCRAGEEAKEGIAAFLQKRAPHWRNDS